MEVAVTTGAIRRAKLQSSCHQQQTNIQFFTARMPFLSPNQQCQSTEGKSTGPTCNYEMQANHFAPNSILITGRPNLASDLTS